MGHTLAVRRSECAADCGHHIQPGERITQGETPSEWFHEDCADQVLEDLSDMPDPERPADWELKPTEKICTRCWIVQPCDCERETK